MMIQFNQLGLEDLNHEKNFFGIRSLGRYIGTDLHLHEFTTMVLCRCGLQYEDLGKKYISLDQLVCR